jgi:NADH dehydrogenase
MKVFLTGATGFLGSAVLEQLLFRGHTVRCLVRSGSRSKLQFPPQYHSAVQTAIGDITQPDSLYHLTEGCDAAIHLVGIIRERSRYGITFHRIHAEGTRNVVNAAKSSRINRFVFVSALGTSPHASSRYHQSKFIAEEYLSVSNLKFTIFRPSIIFGPNDSFVNLLRRFMFPFAPILVPGNGKVLFQPVAANDLSYAISNSLDYSLSFNKYYDVGGPDRLSFDKLIDTIADTINLKHYFKVHIPLPILKPPVKILQNLSFFPLNIDQLTMLSQDNICNPEPFFKDFDVKPTPFHDGIKQYLR